MLEEKSLIGTIITDPKAYYEVADLTCQDFESQQHSIIWHHVMDLSGRDALSKMTLINSLESQNQLDGLASEKARGKAFIDELISMADLTGFPVFAQKVRDKSDKRRLITIAQKLAIEAKNGKVADDIIDEHLSQLLQVRRNRHRDPRPVGGDGTETLETIKKRRAGEIPPLWSPKIGAIKSVVKGLLPVDFMIYVAPPGFGKSSVLRYDALMSAMEGTGVLTFSYENTVEECLTWAVSMLTRIDHYNIINSSSKLTEGNLEEIGQAINTLKDIPWYVLEMWGGIDRIRGVARAEMLKRPVDLIQIDGAYLMSGGRNSSRYDVISENMQALRSLAQELNTPIVATTQFRRGVEDKEEPDQSDLLYAGEMPARIIVSVMKRAMTSSQARQFPENVENGKLKATKDMKAVLMRGHVLKHTNGPVGKTDDIKWLKHIGVFETLQEGWAGYKETPDDKATRLEKERTVYTETLNESFGYSKTQQVQDNAKKEKKRRY